MIVSFVTKVYLVRIFFFPEAIAISDNVAFVLRGALFRIGLLLMT